jgi:hypothetical protein
VFTSYDCVKSVAAKAQLCKSLGLKGLICWDSSGDVAFADPRSLFRAMTVHLDLEKKQKTKNAKRKKTAPAPIPAPAPAPSPSPPQQQAEAEQTKSLTPREQRIVDQLRSVVIRRRLLAGESLEHIAETRKSLRKYLDKTSRFYIE